ncbi:FAD-dependent oxidoreductase [Gordonia sp. McavH-238-E]|uniref:FAD-dependent oxidoreductase n=1 Tax=Gordonia sp. McavH-238-E TaxID=2917736 RepID=UPI0035AB6D3C
MQRRCVRLYPAQPESTQMHISADIVVLGAGPAGYATALRASELGRSVILIE